MSGPSAAGDRPLPGPDGTVDFDDLRQWMRFQVGRFADTGLGGVDLSASLAEHGVGSLQTVRLAGQLEEVLGIEVEPSDLLAHPSIEALCLAVHRVHSGLKARTQAPVSSGERPFNVRLAASFTAEPVAEPLTALLGLAGLPARVEHAPYNQVFQELLDEGGLLGTATDGVSVLLLRLEDWFRHWQPGSSEDPGVECVVGDLLEALRAHLAHLQPLARPVIPVLALAPHSPAAVRALHLAERLDDLDARLLDGARAAGFAVLDLREVAERFRVGRVWDEERDRIGHIPFTPSCFTALGAALARGIATLVGRSAEGAALSPALVPPKVIVLDCDDTLWGGVVGEDGPEGLRTDGPYAELQRFMVVQQQAGRLLCLASKNEEADVWRAFAAHPEMPLRPDHILAHRIGWQRKSESLRELAAELGLGLNSLVFVDDSPVERDEVATALPEVLTVGLPAEPALWPAFLAHHWVFDTPALTEEDRRRTELYRQNRARSELEAGSASFEDFLSRLAVHIDLTPLSEADYPRAAQLTQRTNQFNASKRERMVAEIAALVGEDGRELRGVRVRDRFGDYGLVGLLSSLPRAGRLACDVFLLSCRVLGRRVEHVMVRHLAERARALGLDEVEIDVVPSSRNGVARSFLDGLQGPSLLPELETPGSVRFAAADADRLLSSSPDPRKPPGEDPPGEEPTVLSPSPAGRRGAAASGLDRIACAGADVDGLVALSHESSALSRPALATDYVTPVSTWEKKIAAVWREVLRVDRVGSRDSFYELGGDSLRAAQVFAQLFDLGVPETISLQTSIEPTVAALARAVEDTLSGRRPEQLAYRFSLAAEGRLAEDIQGFAPGCFDRPMRRVLVTGATGYIGAFLVAELLDVTKAEILCLVRAATPGSARQRLETNLRRYGLLDSARRERLARVDVVLGDLGEPRFGLDEAAFTGLAHRIDHIFHAAAWVNFVYPYHHLKRINVDSAETVLRLAVAARPWPIAVHFVSTLGVVMSAGYRRTGRPIGEDEPLEFADDLLNGYEQSKWAADRMVWTGLQERGIPGAIYRPGLVTGPSDGTYRKTDEFMPQAFKGCLQLGAWPALDTKWEMAPVDFVTRSIVHIARDPRNLGRAYFTLHPDARPVSEIIEWHRARGLPARGIPFDIWKRELLGLGAERMRDNALFPFVDFVRALAEEQVWFPPVDTRHFRTAIADLDMEVVPQLELLERYSRYFVESGFYAGVPGASRLAPEPRRALASEAITPMPAPSAGAPGARGDAVDEQIRFDGRAHGASEAYYVLWTDAARGRSMVVRYVLHNGPVEEARVAEVWCWFRDRPAGCDIAIRQRYPLGRAEIENGDEALLRIGPSGYSRSRAWGVVAGPPGRVAWDFRLDKAHAIGVARVSGLDGDELLPRFESAGAKMALSGQVTADSVRYELEGQPASDGHYWDTGHLHAWSWAHCAQFERDPDFFVEGIGARLNDWSQTSTWLTLVHRGEFLRSSLVDSFFRNREISADATSWRFQAERGSLRFVGEVTARPEEQILIVHPLPDDRTLFTHVTYSGDMRITVEERDGTRGRWRKVDEKIALGTASFEVTRETRNPAVWREFHIVRADH